MTLSTGLISTNKQIILCADDYAQNTAISEGILYLAEQGRINATSCMVNTTTWGEMHQALHPMQRTMYVGLHLNLTHGDALSSSWKKYYGMQLPSMSYLLKQAYLRRLNSEVIAAEIQAQLDAYTQAMNTPPDFIDGHQHIHQLPLIREALMSVYARLPSPVLLRKTCNGWPDLVSTDGFPKRQLIALLGGMAFKNRLARQNFPTNSSFSGIYHFKKAVNYRQHFNHFLHHSQDGGLIMCHPGNPSNDKTDPLHPYRHQELNYLMSDAYLSDMDSYSFQLKRKGCGNE